MEWYRKAVQAAQRIEPAHTSPWKLASTYALLSSGGYSTPPVIQRSGQQNQYCWPKRVTIPTKSHARRSNAPSDDLRTTPRTPQVQVLRDTPGSPDTSAAALERRVGCVRVMLDDGIAEWRHEGRPLAQAWHAVLVEVVERCATSALRGSDPGRTSDGRQPPRFGTAARLRR
jgi:hypothetical protein